ncbi:MAG: leucine-rich repeat domain-containing protein [Clostridium sp.]|nr:leucine-rich repeat domain-containing protein [Prevotella sp.]MCM1429069.1 leucine-rich repeat domain-containing protein [Clostridium sp.]MCM1475400.1 leucine-rich repeat domain-containing protein [Muribaculaceae bacterium]
MKRLILMAFCSAAICQTVCAKEIQLTPGSLEGLMPEISSEAELSLKGEADARDLSLMRSLPEALQVLDLSGLSITRFADTRPRYFNRTLFQEGQIPPFCFFKTHAIEVNLPAKTTLIGKGAFAGAALRRAEVPAGVSVIEDYAYYDCPNLLSVVLPESVSSLGKGVFANCPQLRTVDLSNTLITEIPQECFAGCTSLVQVILPANVDKIGREAFRGTAVVALELQDVAVLEPYALSGMNALKQVVLNPDGKIGEGVLMDNASLVALKGAPENIPSHFAANCPRLDPRGALSNATAIGDYAFANGATTSLVFSAGLSKVDRGIFHGISNLEYIEAIDLDSSIPATEEDSFSGLDCGAITLHVSDESYDAWKNDPLWGQFNVVSDINTSTDTIREDLSEGISIYTMGGEIRIIAEAPLLSVDIFSLDGRRLYGATPNASEFTLSQADIHANVIVVVAHTAESSKSTKIISGGKE